MGRYVRYLPSAVIVTVVLWLAACGPPPTPNPPPVTKINQCPELPVNEGGYTRPVPTNHPITTLPVASDNTARIIMWINRTCDRYYIGPIDYSKVPGFCWYRPDIGDWYVGDANNGTISLWLGPLPQSCGDGTQKV